MYALKYFIYLAVLLIDVEMSSPVVNSLCPNFCTYEYNPQCVTLNDGTLVEFSNKCFLNVASCKRYIGKLFRFILFFEIMLYINIDFF